MWRLATMESCRTKALCILVGLLALGGCSSTKVFSQDPDGGVLILDGSERTTMRQAHELMTAHCGVGQYQILRREMVAVGTFDDGYERRPTYESRLTYAC